MGTVYLDSRIGYWEGRKLKCNVCSGKRPNLRIEEIDRNGSGPRILGKWELHRSCGSGLMTNTTREQQKVRMIYSIWAHQHTAK